LAIVLSLLFIWETIQWPDKKERPYNVQIKRRNNTMAKLKGETMQWPNKKERQYNGQIKSRDNTMAK
jgi:hypothetical protein